MQKKWRIQELFVWELEKTNTSLTWTLLGWSHYRGEHSVTLILSLTPESLAAPGGQECPCAGSHRAGWGQGGCGSTATAQLDQGMLHLVIPVPPPAQRGHTGLLWALLSHSLGTAQAPWAHCSTAMLSSKLKRFWGWQIWTSAVPAGAGCVSLSHHTLLLPGPSRALFSSLGSTRAIPSAVPPGQVFQACPSLCPSAEFVNSLAASKTLWFIFAPEIVLHFQHPTDTRTHLYDFLWRLHLGLWDSTTHYLHCKCSANWLWKNIYYLLSPLWYTGVAWLHCWSSVTSFWLKFGLTETWKGCFIALKPWRRFGELQTKVLEFRLVLFNLQGPNNSSETSYGGKDAAFHF